MLQSVIPGGVPVSHIDDLLDQQGERASGQLETQESHVILMKPAYSSSSAYFA